MRPRRARLLYALLAERHVWEVEDESDTLAIHRFEDVRPLTVGLSATASKPSCTFREGRCVPVCPSVCTACRWGHRRLRRRDRGGMLAGSTALEVDTRCPRIRGIRGNKTELRGQRADNHLFALDLAHVSVAFAQTRGEPSRRGRSCSVGAHGDIQGRLRSVPFLDRARPESQDVPRKTAQLRLNFNGTHCAPPEHWRTQE